MTLPSILASKRVPEISIPVLLIGTLAPALPQADGGRPTPLFFLGYPTSRRLHCAPGGVKGPWPLTSSLGWLCSEPANPVTAVPPSCCALGYSINLAAQLPSRIHVSQMHAIPPVLSE